MGSLLEALGRGLLYVMETVASHSAALETSVLGLLRLPTSTRFRTFPPQAALQAIDAGAVHCAFLFIWLPICLPVLLWRERHYAQDDADRRLSLAARMTRRWARDNRRLTRLLTFLRVWAAAILLAQLLDEGKAGGPFLPSLVKGCVMVALL